MRLDALLRELLFCNDVCLYTYVETWVRSRRSLLLRLLLLPPSGFERYQFHSANRLFHYYTSWYRSLKSGIRFSGRVQRGATRQSSPPCCMIRITRLPSAVAGLGYFILGCLRPVHSAPVDCLDAARSRRWWSPRVASPAHVTCGRSVRGDRLV